MGPQPQHEWGDIEETGEQGMIYDASTDDVMNTNVDGIQPCEAFPGRLANHMWIQSFYFLCGKEEIGSDFVISGIEAIKAGMFSQVFTTIVIPHTHMITSQTDQKIALLGFTNIICLRHALGQTMPIARPATQDSQRDDPALAPTTYTPTGNPAHLPRCLDRRRALRPLSIRLRGVLEPLDCILGARFGEDVESLGKWLFLASDFGGSSGNDGW
jgi:hypothetical protein